MAATRLISMHQNKEKSIVQSLHDRTEYAMNGEKTEDGEFISSYECNAGIADQEFLSARSEYLRFHHSYTGDIIAYQIRQSFKPGEITPEEANRVGYETAMRFTKGKHAFFVATHTDRAHIHNHIIFNSVDLECRRKFRDFFFSGIALQRVSDLVCLEHGLSVIQKRKPSEREKRTTYPRKESYRSVIREKIDDILSEGPASFEDFLKRLEEEYYVIKRGKNTALRGRNQKRFIRLSSLGEDYSEDHIRKIIEGDEKSYSSPEIKKQEKSFDMLLDIQAIIAKGKGAGYERWAKVYNIKQVAKVLLFLQEHDCRDYETLAKRAEETSTRFSELSKEIKDAEARMAEIAILRTHIINYGKTKEVYAQYKQYGFSRKFFEAHREEITLHKAAKDAFSKLPAVPKLKDLNVEYSELLAKKKALYAEYRQAKQEMRDYQTAKYDIDRILNMSAEEEQQQKDNQKKRERVR